MWITLDSDDVKNRLSGAEYAGVTSAALASGQTAAGVVAEQIAGVINYVRGFIPPGTARGDGETIPDELADAALAMIVYRILTRLPSLKMLLDDARKSANDAAEKLMRDVAAGRFRIVAAATVDADQPGTATIGVITETTRVAGRANLAGL